MQSLGRSFSNSPPASHWHSIVQSLNELLSILKENFVREFYFVQKLAKARFSLDFMLTLTNYYIAFQVPPILCQKMFTQTFSYINVQIFNR